MPFIPVSYTHLDVYKRQEQASCEDDTETVAAESSTEDGGDVTNLVGEICKKREEADGRRLEK